MKQAANLGFADAAFEMAEQGGEDALDWYRQAAEAGQVDAQAMLARHYREYKWFETAAEGGDFGCLYELAQEASERTDEPSRFDAHKWVYLAELYGHNLTQSRADNEEDYGPAEIIFVGVRLPELSAERRAEAARVAQSVFDAR
jgi:TPR repeat protein